jgi:hypothetical protein
MMSCCSTTSPYNPQTDHQSLKLCYLLVNHQQDSRNLPLGAHGFLPRHIQFKDERVGKTWLSQEVDRSILGGSKRFSHLLKAAAQDEKPETDPTQPMDL